MSNTLPAHSSSHHCRPLLSFASLLLLLLLVLLHPSPIHGQTCNGYSCSPSQGSLPSHPSSSCDLCSSSNPSACSTAYYSQPGFKCGDAVLTVDGAVQLRRAQCCPNSYDGEDEFACVSERHTEESGVVNGFSCVKVSSVVTVLRIGLLVGAIVCVGLFAALSICVWRYCVKVPAGQVTMAQYQQPLMVSVPPSLQSSSLQQPSQPVAPYQPPAPYAPVSEHRPQYEQSQYAQPSEADSQQQSQRQQQLVV